MPGEVEPISITTAERAESRGEYVLAAHDYERLAQTVHAPQKQRYLLRAVDALIKAGQTYQAQLKLKDIQVFGLEPELTAHKRVLEARLKLLDRAYEKAIRRLDEAARIPSLSPQLLAEIHLARAHAELALKNPIAAAHNLINREQYIVGVEAITDNQLQLWTILESLSPAQLRTELNLTREPVLSGWIELALLKASATNRTALFAGIDQWKQTYPGHPASKTVIEILNQQAVRGITGRIERIALLLPLTSDYAVAAQVVRDGFVAMSTVIPEPDRPKITVYDTGSDPIQTPLIYERAIREGAQVVVGPLGREPIDAMLRSGRITIPTVLLGHIDESPTTPAPIYQFGLPPEQEARAVAERAYLDGHRQAVLLYPATSWGERMQMAFTQHWQRLGGLVLSGQAYDESTSDHSDVIKRLLNITESERRKVILEQRLGQRVQFESRPRQDVQFIFLATDTKHGRLIKPQLNFYHAKNIPVYATSHIYSGKADTLQDLDLDGIIFCDMPWMLQQNGLVAELRTSIASGRPYVGSNLDRLYALGMDSSAVLSHLNRIGADPSTRFTGVTGGLSLDRDGRLHRSLAWAKFNRGTPQLLDAQ